MAGHRRGHVKHVLSQALPREAVDTAGSGRRVLTVGITAWGWHPTSVRQSADPGSGEGLWPGGMVPTTPSQSGRHWAFLLLYHRCWDGHRIQFWLGPRERWLPSMAGGGAIDDDFLAENWLNLPR